MKDHDLMPFGRHKGEKLGDVPAHYLLWFADQKWAKDWPELLAYVDSGRVHLEKEATRKER